METDHTINTRRSYFISIHKKKIINLVNFATPAEHKVKVKEEKLEKYRHFVQKE